MTDPVDRTNKLIGLSASTEREEARTAAYQACELIRKRNLIVAPREEYEHLIQTAIDQCDRIKRLTEELARSEAERAASVASNTQMRHRSKAKAKGAGSTGSTRDQVTRIIAKAGGRLASTLLRDVLAPERERER